MILTTLLTTFEIMHMLAEDVVFPYIGKLRTCTDEKHSETIEEVVIYIENVQERFSYGKHMKVDTPIVPNKYVFAPSLYLYKWGGYTKSIWVKLYSMIQSCEENRLENHERLRRHCELFHTLKGKFEGSKREEIMTFEALREERDIAQVWRDSDKKNEQSR